MNNARLTTCLAGIFCFLCALPLAAEGEKEKDSLFFLKRLRTIDHLPELEDSHTSMTSRWHRVTHSIVESSNKAVIGTPLYRNIKGNRNILLDVDGPGSIHRIFTGTLGDSVAGTKIQIFLDGEEKPIFDLPVDKFFNDKSGPFPSPLVFRKNYGGTFLPIPFASHCLVQLVNEQKKNWGNQWEVTYTTWPAGTKVKTLTWPPGDKEKAEMKRVCDDWLRVQSTPPEAPKKWAVEKKFTIEPFDAKELKLTGTGIIRQMRIAVKPGRPSLLRSVRLQIFWDGAKQPSVDVPLGYFFGHANYGHHPKTNFNSILMGVTEKDAWSLFPMPFEKGAVFKLENRTKLGETAEQVRLFLDIEKRRPLPENFGRFHATWVERRANSPGTQRFRGGAVHTILDRETRGKYVGLQLHLAWPVESLWWGKGDFQIWTDQKKPQSWPPRYQGSSADTYFNCSGQKFDRKAVSGYLKVRPGDVGLYSFHLNDAFQFREQVRVAVVPYVNPFWFHGWGKNKLKKHPIWGSTAYWYAEKAEDAQSSHGFVTPRWMLDLKRRKEILMY